LNNPALPVIRTVFTGDLKLLGHFNDPYSRLTQSHG